MNRVGTSSNSVNLTSRSEFHKEYKGVGIFSNPIAVSVIVLIGLIFMAYGFYSYYFDSAITDYEIKSNSSYYGKDITLYEPIFKENANTITDCVVMCENDVICDGVTYNNNSQTCTGTKNGTLRNESSEYSAWVKPIGQKQKTNDIDFTKAILIGYSKSFRVLEGSKIMNPYMLGNFSWSFNLTIYDFYKNYGSWRHIFHKGTPITTGQVLTYQSWENLIQEIPNQQIGVWLAPFTNNLRIAITTTSQSNRTFGSYNDAFVQKCNYTGNCFITDMPSGKWTDTSRVGDGSNPNTQLTTNIEYFDQDLQNIPINTTINIIINFYNTVAEVYFNGKMVKVTQLDGTPINDKSNLYVLNDKTANCEIGNLIFYPQNLKIADIAKVINIKPSNN
jgi:hypothetical protein